MTTLKGITWDHPRGIDSLLAASEAYAQQKNGLRIEWTARALHEFEDTPVTILAESYDLLAMDHPFIGDAVRDGALHSLDGLLTPVQLAERARDSVGLSHESYRWRGRQWALAVDAACMVSAHRPDLIDTTDVPTSWADLNSFSQRIGRDKILLAANPTHLWGTLLSLCDGIAPAAPRQNDGRPAWWGDGGIDGETLRGALELLREVLAFCSPDSLSADPISVLERLSSSDEISYSPLVFGYVTYSRVRPGRSIVRFTNAPMGSGGTAGTLIGGVGLAVSAHSAHPADAADFIRFTTETTVQRGLYAAAGGQPGRRSAWTDSVVNGTTDDFFIGTLPTMDRSFLRARLAGYPAYQRAASAALHTQMVDGAGVPAIASRLTQLWREHVAA